MWFHRRALKISYVQHVSNEEVLSRVSQIRKLLSRVKSRKMKYRSFGHVAHHPSMDKDIMLGPMPRTRRQGGQKWQWLDDITDWAKLELPSVVQETDASSDRSFIVSSKLHTEYDTRNVHILHCLLNIRRYWSRKLLILPTPPMGHPD